MAVNDVDQDAAVAAAEEFFRQQLPAEWVAAVDSGDGEALAAARRDVDADEIWSRIAAGGYVVPTWDVEHGGLGVVPKVGAAIALSGTPGEAVDDIEAALRDLGVQPAPPASNGSQPSPVAPTSGAAATAVA